MKDRPDREPILKYADARIDRAAALREDPGWVEKALKQSDARIIATWRSRHLLCITESDQPRAVRLSPEHLAEHMVEHGEAVFLGMEDSMTLFAVDLSDRIDPEPELEPEASFVDLRRFGPLLDGHDANLLAYARAMLNWHRNHQYCGRCGAATASSAGGHRRQCTSKDCGHMSFPRTDPAIIVLVEHPGDDDGPPRCLLGRSAHFPEGMYSTLAGFVEPGESLEQTVRREVFEEAGIELASVRYLASQPWPFPGSLMLGFHATASSTIIRRNDEELEAVRWFSLDEVDQFGESGETDGLCLPRPDSIARFLIDHWCDKMHGRESKGN
ncbi:NAD(+) diphosphatase [Wenzhouxiangella sp. AB-CW3]|uniref:NAD(+) diphosphatase n=1 Tax=Wenzhouxiangella sp. AB-CW3 TaxID=2771012 RepID=UPI00168C0DC3|nr:NAD(+) diphosphatase [Wenzhouxiangella sp. AB-CW3]QOC23267.1 NAD(+) diphosphatase [Wenzhouxiangella sp. AB-CW3]